jgi:transposase
MPPLNRRARKPEPFWLDLITRWKTSGQSVAAFCAARGVSQASFYAWRKRLTARSKEPIASTPPAPTFAAVRVLPGLPVEVLLPTGAVVRVPAGADPAVVARLVAALGGGPC